MPIIEMHMLEGRTVEQKHSVARAITDAIVTSLGVPADTVRIMITEHDSNGFYVAGIPRRKSPTAINGPAPEQKEERKG